MRIANLWRTMKFRLRCAEFGHGNVVGKDVLMNRPQRVAIGSNVTIHKDTLLHVAASDKKSKEPLIVIGDRVHLSFRTWITARCGITIGDDTGFAPGVVMQDYSHGYEDVNMPVHAQPLVDEAPITIGKGCFLAANVVVVAGVTIGDNAVIGANSVVTGDIPPRSLAVGCPAKVVRRYDEQTGKWVRV